MAIYDSTDHKLGDYLLGKATGYYDNAYSSLGAEHYRHTQKLRDEALSITYRPSQSGPGIFDDAFAEALRDRAVRRDVVDRRLGAKHHPRAAGAVGQSRSAFLAEAARQRVRG